MVWPSCRRFPRLTHAFATCRSAISSFKSGVDLSFRYILLFLSDHVLLLKGLSPKPNKKSLDGDHFADLDAQLAMQGYNPQLVLPAVN